MLAAQTSRQILIVDRDIAAIEPLRQRLCERGFSVRAMAHGAAAMAVIAEQAPHLLIIDWDGLGLRSLEALKGIHEIRAPHTGRLIILSSLSGEDQVLAALRLGADDYISKPYSLPETVARVAALLRSGGRRERAPRFEFDGLELDSHAHCVTVQGVPLAVLGVRYLLLEFLISHCGQAFTRRQLLEQVWGAKATVDERTIDVNVQRLRRLLGGCGYRHYIQTVRGFGYRFSPR